MLWTPRRSRSGWEIIAAVGALVIGLIWAAGGFNRADAYLGPARSAGDVFRTRYFDIAVLRAGVVGAGGPQYVGVVLTVTNKFTESRPGLTQDAVLVKLSDGRVLAGPSCDPVDGKDGSLDPLVATQTLCLFSLVQNRLTFDSAGDQPIDVIVLDQTPEDEALAARSEAVLPPVGHVRLNARWLVQ